MQLATAWLLVEHGTTMHLQLATACLLDHGSNLLCFAYALVLRDGRHSICTWCSVSMRWCRGRCLGRPEHTRGLQVGHSHCSEAAVVGYEHPVKGQVLCTPIARHAFTAQRRSSVGIGGWGYRPAPVLYQSLQCQSTFWLLHGFSRIKSSYTFSHWGQEWLWSMTQ